MYIFKNALENLLRNKGRNILIMAIIFIIIVTTVVALIINNTARAVIDDYRDRFSSEVTIAPDIQKLRDEATANASSSSSSTSSSGNNRVSLQIPTITPEQLLSFTKSDDLQKSEAYGTMSANSDSITAIDQSSSTDTSNSTDISNNNASNPGSGNGDNTTNSSSTDTGGGRGGGFMYFAGGGGNFTMYGGDWENFDSGDCSLVDDGQSVMPSAANECLISQDLADLNNLSVGDTMSMTVQLSYDIPDGTDMSSYSDGDTYKANNQIYTLSASPDGSFRATRNQAVTLKVVGIYDDLRDAYDNSNMPALAMLNHRNEIYTTLDTLLAFRGSNEGGVNLSVTYYLKSPDLLSDFEQYCRAAGLSDDFTVSTDSTSYDTIVKPVQSLKSITLTFMIVVLILGAVILILLTTIAIRERKYEIGVLRAMGMKKRKVALGLWSELLVATGLCLVLGIGVGSLAAQPITNILLTQQAQAAASSTQSDQTGFGGSSDTSGGPGAGGRPMGITTIGSGGRIMAPGASATNAQPLSEMKITIGWDTILEIIGIALVLATLAGLISTSRITKYEPIKILMDRN